MKKILIIILCMASVAQASISIVLQAGDLKANSAGTIALPTGYLLLLVASGADGTFTNALTQGQYVAGDDVILAAFASNNNLLGASATSNTLTNLTGVQNQKIELRWFPSTLFSNYGTTTPATGDYFGVFAGATSGTPDSGSPWLIPTNGTSLYPLNFQTVSLSGTQPNNAGYATLQVAAVPEPTTFALLGLGMGFAGWMARRKKA